MKEGVCGHHENMLEKQEFRWVFGICFIVICGVTGWMLSNSANISQIEAINEKIQYRDRSAEARSARLERSMEKLNEKLDNIDEYIRSGTAGTRRN
jgi:hypothetical protein